MIEPPPLLTIRRRFARPSKAVLAAFAGVPISQIADGATGFDWVRELMSSAGTRYLD